MPKRTKNETELQAARAEVSEEAIARRAYEISQSDSGGSSEENWQRAEHELREEAVQEA